MASDILDRVAMVVNDMGTGDVTANVLISDRFNTPQEAGARNGKSYWWMLEEGVNYQIFEGVWTLATTRVARTKTWQSKINGVHGAANLDLQGNATLRSITPAEALTYLRCAVPQGRLTLQSNVPVMTSTQSSKTTLYYTPYSGTQIPVFDGINMQSMTFSELSVAIADTTKSPAAVGASKVNDWFVWNDSGTLRLSHGPNWTDDATRSAGTALTLVDGILLNAVDILNGPAASRGTYVGTTRSNGASQLDFILGGYASGGVAAWIGLWNAYNRRDAACRVADSSSATYSGGVRSFNGSDANRVSCVAGLAEDTVVASFIAVTNIPSGGASHLGIGRSSISITEVEVYFYAIATPLEMSQVAPLIGSQPLGFSFLQALQYHAGAGAGIFFNGVLSATVKY